MLRAMKDLGDAEIQPAKPTKCKIVVKNFDGDAVTDAQLKSAFGPKLNKITVLRGNQLLLELNDHDFAEKCVKDGLPVKPFMLRFRWFTIKPPTIIQCFNCFAFGHYANDCQYEQRCSKCSGRHDYRVCQQPVMCCNCRGPHLAIDKNCPARKINTSIT